jgi:hypothetical protein
MNLQLQRITVQYDQLSLGAMANNWSNIASQILKQEGSYAESMEQLLQTELLARQERTKVTLLKFSALPVAWTGMPKTSLRQNSVALGLFYFRSFLNVAKVSDRQS